MDKPKFLFEIKATKACGKHHELALKVVQEIISRDLTKEQARQIAGELLQASELAHQTQRSSPVAPPCSQSTPCPGHSSPLAPNRRPPPNPTQTLLEVAKTDHLAQPAAYPANQWLTGRLRGSKRWVQGRGVGL
jgi:hypothetical protein